MKKYLAIVLSIILSFAFAVGCSSKSASDIITGKWTLESDTDSGWEFFTDGSMIASNGDDSDEANWSISEDSLKLSNPNGDETLLFNIQELTEERLVLTIDGVDQELVLVKEK